MKKVLSLVLAMLLLCSLTACGGGDDVSSAPMTDVLGEEIAPAVYAQNVDAVFEEGTVVTAVKILEGDTYGMVKAAVADVATKITIYDMKAMKDEATVQPNGKLKVTFDLPADYSTNVTLYYVSDDGVREELATEVDASARTASAELEHFSLYVLADNGEVTTTASATTTTAAPTTAKPTTAKPTTAKPTTAKPTTAKPTTAKPTTATPTTAKPTTAVVYSGFANSNWEAYHKVNEEQCKWITFQLTDAEKSYGEMVAGPAWVMFGPDVDESTIDQEPDFVYDGTNWYGGGGGGGPVDSVTQVGNTVTIVADEGGCKLVLECIAADKAKVVSETGFYIAVGTVFTKVK